MKWFSNYDVISESVDVSFFLQDDIPDEKKKDLSDKYGIQDFYYADDEAKLKDSATLYTSLEEEAEKITFK